MDLTWILETNNYYDVTTNKWYKSQSNELVETFKKNNKNNFVIYDSEKSFVIDKNIPYIFKGTISGLNTINKLSDDKEINLIKPSTFSNYDCSVYYQYYKDFLFNSVYDIIPVHTFKENLFYYFNKYKNNNISDSCIFIRPDSGQKSFTGHVSYIQDYENDNNNKILTNDNETIVITYSKENLQGEYRFICTNDKYGKEIIAKSCYSYGKNYINNSFGNSTHVEINNCPKKATELVEFILDNSLWFPDTVFVMDIFQTTDDKFYLGEINSFSCSGLYAMDKIKIIDKVEEIIKSEILQ